MDFSGFSVEHLSAAKPCVIKHPVTGKDTDTVVHVVSYASDELSDIIVRQRDAKIARAKLVDGVVSIPEPEEGESRADLLELVCAAIKGWDNMEFGGEALEPTPDNIRFIASNVPTIRRQVDNFAGDSTNYFMV